MGFPEEKLESVTIIKINKLTTADLNASKFKEYLLNFMYKGKKKIILDFSEVRYIDSAFIGALILSSRILRTTGTDLKIVRTGDHGHFWSLFEASSSFSDFVHYNNVYDAVSSFCPN